MLEGFVSAISEILRFVTDSFPPFMSQNLQFVRAQRALARLSASRSALTKQWIAVPYLFWYMGPEHRTMPLFA